MKVIVHSGGLRAGQRFKDAQYADEEKEDPVSRSEMTLDNADPAMLQMFSNWKSSKITNADGSWTEFMDFLNAG